MPDARWKRHERQVARRLGTVRQPSDGKATPDMVTDRFAIEHKSRETLPKWLTDAISQAHRNARGAVSENRPKGRLPLVVLSSPQGRGRQPLRLVVMELDVFQQVMETA